MKQKLLSGMLLAWLTPQLQAQQTPTWSADIAPILYAHCTNCHRDGGIGPFALETYQDAADNAYAVLDAVETGEMPPWRADPNYRHFKDENVLSSAQITAIKDWVNGGQPAGDLNQAPPLPNYQSGSQLSKVDITLKTPLYTVAQDEDEYRAFVIPTGVTEDAFFNEIEIDPANDAIVHHIVVYTDPTNEPLLRDQADPGPGFKTNGMVGNITQNATLIAEWTPGGTPIKMPPNFGYRIPKNGYYIVELHFAPGNKGAEEPGAEVRMRLTDNPDRELYYGVLVYGDSTSGLLNPPFHIPANTQKTLLAELKVSDLAPLPLSVLTLTPHAHVVCTSFKAFAYRPGFTDTIPLISVPHWDFHWQGTYILQKPLRLNTNRTCRAEVTYDNTVNNPENPHDPPQDVWWGEKTTDEMLYLFATVVIYQPGDENLVLDSSLLVRTQEPVALEDESFRVTPNPATDWLDVQAKTPVEGKVELILIDMLGRTLRRSTENNLTALRLPVGHLPPGLYALYIRQKGRVSSYRFLKE